MCSKEMGLCAQNMITILCLLANILEGDLIWPFIEHKNLHFDNE